MHNKTFDIVTGIIASVTDSPAEQLTPDTSLLSDLVIDSLRLYEIVIELEETFNVRITDNDLDRAETIGDIVALLNTM